MPAIETDGLSLNFFLKRNDPRDVFISRDKIKLRDLKSKYTGKTVNFNFLYLK